MEKVDAVIVTYNRLPKLKYALECYDKQTTSFRTLIIVDNCSTDGTIEFLKKWEIQHAKYNKHVIYLPSNIGGSGGFYEGERYAMTLNPDWVYVADDDAYPEDRMVEKFERFYALHKENKIAAICTSVWDMTDSIMKECRSHITFINSIFEIKPATDEEYQMPFFEFNCLSYVGCFISSKALSEKGLVNKDFFIYQDDVDHSLRLNQYGKMYCIPDMKVIHDSVPAIHMTNDALSKVLWKEYYAVRNRAYMLLKYNYFIGLKAMFEELRHVRSHYEKTMSPIDKMTIEGCKDAYLGRLGIHSVYRPGLDVRICASMPYPKYLWQVIYLVLRFIKLLKKK